MKRFRFRLERLLHVRRVIEGERARVLQQSVAEVEEMRRKLDRSVEERVGIMGQIGRAGDEKRTAGDLTNIRLAADAADRRVEENSRLLAQAEERMREATKQYHESRRDLKAVEKMKERKREGWMVETSRAEQKEFDEIAGRIRSTTGGV